MSEIVAETLKKAAKGTAIAFVGMLSYFFSEFITCVIIARNTSQSEYGTFNIGLVLLYLFVTLSCLGLTGGVPRYIAYLRGKGENDKVRGVICTADNIYPQCNFRLLPACSAFRSFSSPRIF